MAQSIKVTQAPRIKVVLVNDDTVNYPLEVWPKMMNVVIVASAPAAPLLTMLGVGS